MTAYRTAARWVAAVIDSVPEASELVGSGIHIGIAPKGAVHPIATVQKGVNPDDTNFNRGRYVTRVELIVRFWVNAPAAGMPDTDAAEVAYEAVDAVLHGASNVNTELGRVASCRRVRESPYIEHRETETVEGVGGVYVVEVA